MASSEDRVTLKGKWEDNIETVTGSSFLVFLIGTHEAVVHTLMIFRML
jgi:hypothetical protein